MSDLPVLPSDVIVQLRGMIHSVTLRESNVPNHQLLTVKTLMSEASATMTPPDRYELAKALWPAAFEDTPFLQTEFRIEGEEHCFKNQQLAELTGRFDALVYSRRCTPWERVARLDGADEGNS